VGERDTRPGTATRKELLSKTPAKQLLRGRTRRVRRGLVVSSRVSWGSRQGQVVSSRTMRRRKGQVVSGRMGKKRRRRRVVQ